MIWMPHLRSWQNGGSEAESWSLAAAVARYLLQGVILSQRKNFQVCGSCKLC